MYYSSKKMNILIGISLILMVSLSLAGTSGKIVGYITDEASGEALPGANVIIDGSSLGAASNNDGYYSILNVSPGTYSLRVTIIGYKPVVVKNVRVKIDLTTTIDVKMNVKAVGMEEVVVVAKRSIIAADVSASELNISIEEIETMPVKDIEDVINLQAGVEDGLTIRGSSARQSTFIVDGFNQNDERSHVPFTSVNLNTVQEVKVQTGGFNAEYGQSRSGVINVITKEGSKTEYNGGISILIRPAGKKYFGPSVYSPESYFLKPYLDPEVCYVGTNNGSWDQYTQEQYPDFPGWNYISDVRFQNDNPDDDLTPEGAKRLFEYQHRRKGDIVKPDHVVDLSLGGPVPIIGKYLGDLRFFGSYRDLREMLLIPVSRESYDDKVGRLKVTSDISPDIKLTFIGRFEITNSASPYTWTTTPTGSVLRSDYSLASRANSELLYVPAWYSPADIYRTQIGIKLNHMLSSDTYYEINIQRDLNEYFTNQMGFRDTTDNHDIFPGEGEYLVDEQPEGYWGYSVGSIGDNMRIGGWQNLGRDSSKIATTKLNFDFISQLNNRNLFKAGIDVVLNEYDIRSTTSNPGMETWNRAQNYKVDPYRIGLFAQDKIEFEGFIANIGLRLDYTHANREYFTMDRYSEYYKTGNGNLIEEEAPSKKIKPSWDLLPRLGISHPITENSKLYFNYGHFRTEPSSTYRFRIQRYYDGSVTSIGNANLLQEKTVSYEVGYSHNIFNTFFLNIAGYYKNVTNQIGWIDYKNIDGSVNYSKPDNNQYEDIRGFEITLDKKTGRWITGFINYTYMVNTLGYFGYLEYYEDPNEMREYLMENPYQSKPHPEPYTRMNITFHSPDDFGLNMANIYPLGGWNMNVLATWRAGAYWTYNPSNILGPGVINNVQWKDSYNIDLRLAKTIKTKKLRITFFADVSNLLNTKRLSYAGRSGSRDWDNYMKSLHFDWEEGVQNGDDRIGEYRDWEVEYVPMQSVENIEDVSSPDSRSLYYDSSVDQYLMYQNEQWEERTDDWVQKNVLDKKAYINMPDIRAMTFLYPRSIELGVKLYF